MSSDGWVELDDPAHRIRWWMYGDGDATLMVLHGGPGAGHRYLQPLIELADDALQVLMYDQLGSGESTRPDDPTLWTIQRSVAETERVRTALGLGRVHVLGQSSGGFLALEYALAHPDSVLSLVLSNTAASAPETVRYMSGLRNALPADAYATLLRHEAAGTTDADDYQAIVTDLYAAHLRRSHPYEPNTSRAEYLEHIAPLLADSDRRTARCGESMSSSAPGRF